MLASSIPYKFKTPWGASASAPNYITTPIPATSTGAAAGQDLGFPPITATPTGAGGTPPNINDVNGALNYETLWTRWLQAGGPVGYDATFSTNIGGYPRGAIIHSATFGQYWLSTVDNNTSDPDTGGAGWVPAYSGRLINIQNFTTPGTFTYTPTVGMTSAIVYVQGAGGATGGVNATISPEISIAGGASSGALAIGQYSAATIGASQSVTVGAGGTAGAPGNSSGGSGGTSSFGTIATAQGGIGTQGYGPTSSTNFAAPGAGSGSVTPPAAVGGNIQNVGGAPGVTSIGGSSLGPGGGPAAIGGLGGGSLIGGGGIGPGSGGGGPAIAGTESNTPGNNGYAGQVLIMEYA